MSARLVWGALILVGCGARSALGAHAGEAADATADAAFACDPNAPFHDITPLDVEAESDLRFTSDELTAVWAPWGSQYQLLPLATAHRTQIDAAFDSVNSLPGVGFGLAPNLSDDRLDLIAMCLIALDEGGELCEFSRPSVSQPFASVDVGVDVSTHKLAPANNPYVIAQGLVVYYDSFGAGMARASRPSRGMHFGGAAPVEGASAARASTVRS